MAVDPTFSNLPLYALPIAVVIALASIPGVRAAKKLRTAWYTQMRRAPGDVRPGPGHFEIETIGEAPTNFGSSSEQKGPSPMPTLVTEAVTVQLCGGPRVRLAAGKQMQALLITGATRRQGSSVTTPSGITTPYSFEVPPGTRLHVRASLVAPSGGNYRDDAVLDLVPAGESYLMMGQSFDGEAARNEPLLTGVLFTVFGTVGGMFLSNAWRGGCNRKGMLPLAVFVDALCIATVIGALGLHYAAARMIPPKLDPPR